MKDEKVFNTLYSKLNKAQKEAVDTIEGPVMVIAGPGTGKTQILTLRIANILKRTDVPPDAILALTFTDAGVYAMRKRLASIIGATAYRVPIFTFHGFCNEVIARFSAHFPELVGSRPAGAIDRIMLMQEILDASKLKKLSSYRSPYHYVKKVLDTISLLKREAITPKIFVERLDKELVDIQSAEDYTHKKGAYKGKVRNEYKKLEESNAKNRELLILYEKYESAMAKSMLYDFDDMILAVVNKVEGDENLRLILQEEFQYILADEHQDANGAQNRVLELLSSFHESPNIFIVGDDKQAIYRFQGASLENFRYFQTKFSDAKLIQLEENYRSTQSVLDTAHKLIAGVRGQALAGQADKSRKLLAKSGHSEKPIIIEEHENVEGEMRGLCSRIKILISNGVPSEEIAVFTRKNRDLSLYSGALIRAGIPVSINTSKDALDDNDIEKLLTLIRASAGVGEDEWLIRALHLSCFKVSELDIYVVAGFASKNKISVWDVLNDKKEFDLLKLSDPGELLRVYRLILNFAKLGANSSPAELVTTIVWESGLMAEIVAKHDAEDKLGMVSLLISYLNDGLKTKRNTRIADLPKLLELLDEYDVLETNVSGRASGRVQMMTAHKAKGLEFDHVFIVGAVEGAWSGGRTKTDFKIPGLMSISKEDEEDDDRRLFYVALTRARKELFISYPRKKEDGGEILGSRFLDDLPRELISRTVAEDSSDAMTKAEALRPIPTKMVTIQELKDFVKETLIERGLSVSGLNDYLKCPWRYFYRTLLRVTEKQTVPLMLGNAIHRSLSAFFDSLGTGDPMTKEGLVGRFESEMSREPLTDKELESALEEGASALRGYVDFYAGKFEKNIKNEYPIDVIFNTGDFGLRLTGKLDKMEFLPGGGVSVVDYKTGKHKSRNEIEGKTKDSDGDYKRQLVFYNFLLNRYNDGVYNMKSGVIDFVMPDDNGNYRREEFYIEPEEVSGLENLIKDKVREIVNVSFWDKRCDDRECEYCKLREMMN